MQELELKMEGGLMRAGGRNRGILRYITLHNLRMLLTYIVTLYHNIYVMKLYTRDVVIVSYYYQGEFSVYYFCVGIFLVDKSKVMKKQD